MEFTNLHVSAHPAVQHKLALLRAQDSEPPKFRQLVREISWLVGYEALADARVRPLRVTTPLEETDGVKLADRIGLVPILRAGLGMVDGILELYPTARVGHVGLYRDPGTLKPVEYYCKLPTDLEERELIVVDPMLATGGSVVAALDLIKRKGGKKLKLLALIAAPEGIKVVQDAHPDVEIFTAAIDDYLNEHAYIIPGLGDAGDRLFGTK